MTNAIKVGAGSGLTFAHYPPQVSEVIAVEPERRLRAATHAAARTARVHLRVVDGVADALPGRDAPAAITAAAGFVIDDLHRFRIPPAGPPSPGAPHICGAATHPGDGTPR